MAANGLLLRLLVKSFAAEGPVVVGLDDTIERHQGEKIAARRIYRDPVRSSHSHCVKVSGLRWLSLELPRFGGQFKTYTKLRFKK